MLQRFLPLASTQDKVSPKLKDTICPKIDLIHFENYSEIYVIPFIKIDGLRN